jgi:AcrR family transcriptional regulator
MSPVARRVGRVPREAPTRERILDAATDLFGLRGVDAVSLDVIATEVGVAKQTLLYWFPSKDELVTRCWSGGGRARRS